MQVKEAWKLPFEPTASVKRWELQIKSRVDKIKIFSDRTYLRYVTFLDSCGSKTMFSDEGHVANLEMIDGEYYDEDTLKFIEYPLMSTITSLLKNLENEQREAHIDYGNLVKRMIHNMKTCRKHTHGTTPARLSKRSEAMRNRKRVAACDDTAEEL